MTTKEALDIMIKSHRFRILGYVSQDGRVENIDCELLMDGENYTHLVRRAVGVATRLSSEPVPEGFDPAVWAEALREQSDSWLKHLSEHPVRLIPNDRPSVLHYEPLNPADIEEGVAVTDILCDRELVSGKEKKPVSAKAIAKDFIRRQTEVCRFTSKLILAYGKFQSVEMLEGGK